MGLVLVFSSPTWSSLPGIKQIGDTVRSLEGKTLTISLRDKHTDVAIPTNDRVMHLRWGDMQVPLSTKAGPDYAYEYQGEDHHKFIVKSKAEVLTFVRGSLSWIKDGMHSHSPEQDWVRISLRHVDKSGEDAYWSDLYRGLPAKPDGELVDMLDHAHHGSSINLEGQWETENISIVIYIVDETTMPTFLKFQQRQFEILPVDQEIQIVNVVRPSEMVALLNQDVFEVQLSPNRRLSTSGIRFYQHFDQPPAARGATAIAEQIESYGEIAAPIFAFLQNDETYYKVIFDDEPNPSLTRDSWGEVFNDPHKVVGARWSVTQSERFNWGPLSIRDHRSRDSNTSEGLQVFYHKEPLDLHSAHIPDLRKMLRDIPEWRVDGEIVKRIGIILEYTDRAGIPFSCSLKYDQGRPIHDSACLKRMLASLEKGDFLTIRSIYSGADHILPPVRQIKIN